MRAATPAWLRMPSPTTETLAIDVSDVTPPAPISAATSFTIARAF